MLVSCFCWPNSDSPWWPTCFSTASSSSRAFQCLMLSCPCWSWRQRIGMDVAKSCLCDWRLVFASYSTAPTVSSETTHQTRADCRIRPSLLNRDLWVIFWLGIWGTSVPCSFPVSNCASLMAANFISGVDCGLCVEAGRYDGEPAEGERRWTVSETEMFESRANSVWRIQFRLMTCHAESGNTS